MNVVPFQVKSYRHCSRDSNIINKLKQHFFTSLFYMACIGLVSVVHILQNNNKKLNYHQYNEFVMDTYKKQISL